MFPEAYPEQERRCFAYRVGTQTLYADPLTVRRRLDHYLARPLNDVLAEAQSADPVQRFGADEALLTASRLAFEKPWDELTGAGATEEEMRAALVALTDFLSGCGTSGLTPPPISQPMDPSSPSPIGMTPTSVYGST